MATTLSEFHTLVSDALGRSTSLDSVLTKRVAMAAAWIERNYTFQYMRQYRLLTIDPDATYPHIISLTDIDLKKIELMRIRTVGSDGGYLYSRPLKKVRPADRENRPVGTPESYWQLGVSSIILGSVPDTALVLEVHTVEYTRWQSASGWRHWLLDNATELLLARTLQLMSVRTRDPKMYDMFEMDLQKEIQSFNVAEEDLVEETFQARYEPLEDFSTSDTWRDS